MLKLVFFHIQAHLNAFFQILEYFSQSVEVDGLNLLAYSVFESFDFAGCIFVHFPFNRPQRKNSAGVRSGDLGGQMFFEIILSISRMLAFEV